MLKLGRISEETKGVHQPLPFVEPNSSAGETCQIAETPVPYL
jgi:hypothetical protein